MLTLSTRSKEAIKTGLAMTIAYGIALYMDWDKPNWAGIAVAMISLATAGQSLNKGAMRMPGTLVGATNHLPTPEDARKDGHICGRSRRFMKHPG
jgi:uncharacterized membrane protein YccC